MPKPSRSPAYQAPPDLPSGVKLRLTLEGHAEAVTSLAFDPKGDTLASSSIDGTVKLWDAASGRLLRTLEVRGSAVTSVAFDGAGRRLASGNDNTVHLWDAATGRLLRTLEGHRETVWSVAFDGKGRTLASGSSDGTVRLWDAATGRLLSTLECGSTVHSVAFDGAGGALASGSGSIVQIWEAGSGKLLRALQGHGSPVYSVAFDGAGRTLVSGSMDQTVRIWDASSGRLLRTLEGHKGCADALAFSRDESLLASKGDDDAVRLWRCDTWEPAGVIPEPKNHRDSYPALAFHPSAPLLSSGGTAPDTTPDKRGQLIHVWELDYAVLLGKERHRRRTPASVSYSVAKVLLVGDTGVGKSGLACRLVKREFALTESTHGRQIHTLRSAEVAGAHGERIQRETVLWDLAGQPGYRLIHQLQMSDAAVALVLFDSRSETDPFAGAAFWAEALDQAAANAPIVKLLVAARVDRGGVGVSEEEIQRFVKRHGFAGYVRTSAKTGEGIAALADAIETNIRWSDLPMVTSTTLMQQVRSFVTASKSEPSRSSLQTVATLRADFRVSRSSSVSDDEFAACLSRLEHTDVVDVLRQYVPGDGDAGRESVLLDHEKGDIARRRRDVEDDDLVLLQPSYVDAYASAIIIAAKDDPRGIGHLPEEDVFNGQFPLNKEERMPDSEDERRVLQHVVKELLRRELALRESLDDGDYLVFPSQYTREAPFPGTNAFGVSYDFKGPVRSVFTTLVVRLAHHTAFTEREFYKDAAAYDAGGGGKCVVLLRDTVPGAGQLSVFFEGDVTEETQAVFLRYVYQHLERRAVPGSITRQREYHCRKCRYEMDDRVVEKRLRESKPDIVCPQCDDRQPLYDLLLRESEAPSAKMREIDEEAREAKSRELAISRVESMRERREHDVFLSYNSADRAAVVRLAEDLKAVGLRAWLDVWDLIPGRPWQEALEAAIDKIPCAAICIGPAGIGQWQAQEMQVCLDKFVQQGKRVIPVFMPNAEGALALPIFFRSFSFVDLRDHDVTKGDGLRLLVAGILGLPPSDVPAGTLDAMLVARLRERQRRRKTGPKKPGSLLVPLDLDFQSFDELSKKAVAAQIAELLDIPAEEVRATEVTEGSVRINMEFDDVDEACRFWAQIHSGKRDALAQFEKWNGKKEDFMKENEDCATQAKTGLSLSNVTVGDGATLVIGDGSGGVGGGMKQSALGAGSSSTKQTITVTKEEAADALAALQALVKQHINDESLISTVTKQLNGAQLELEEDKPDNEKVAKRTGHAIEALKTAGAGAKWFNDVVKFGEIVATYVGPYAPMIVKFFSGV